MVSGKFILIAAFLAGSSVVAAARPAHHRAASPVRVAADIEAAVSSPARPAEQVKLDESRRPAEVLKFAGLKRGDMALDLFGGSGYYSEIMARAVGPKGGVLAWLASAEVNPKTLDSWKALKARQPNVGYFMTPNDALSLPASSFDFAMININYHDTYWESARFGFRRMEPDSFLKTLYQAMKPGGVVAVIDHVANPGGDVRQVADKLHRIDPAIIRSDWQRAGFVLEGESNVLRNPADDHSKLVFDPSIRGKTDRVTYRFRKPAR
jgi:predicted methyltransferase